jgi:hypothetical protein
MAEDQSTARARISAKEEWNTAFMAKELAAAKLTGLELPYHSKVRIRVTARWADYGAAVGAAMVRWVDWDTETNKEIPGGGADALQLITAAEAIHPQRLMEGGGIKEPTDEDLGVDANKARLLYRRIVLKAFRHEAGVPDTPSRRSRKAAGGGSTVGDDASTATGALQDDDDTNMTEGVQGSEGGRSVAGDDGDDRGASRSETPVSVSASPALVAAAAHQDAMPPPAVPPLPPVSTLPGISFQQ